MAHSTKLYYIKTFGCAQNEADSERIETYLAEQGMKRAISRKDADYFVINTCIVRESAENRIYGLINNLKKQREKTGRPEKIVLTGCMVGLMFRDKSGKEKMKLQERLKSVDEFLPIDEIGFDNIPSRNKDKQALVPISEGCNNFCSYCVVPFTRGKEVSRPFDDILAECQELEAKGYKQIMLLGQNVNSYGADLLKKPKGKKQKSKVSNITYVKHLGKYRIPTLFPQLLDRIAKLGFEKVSFMSSNPWDFSDKLIDVIAKNKNVNREIHLPVQSGDDKILRRMNRWYTAEEYLKLIKKIRNKIINATFTTDIIVGFPGETEEAFQNTVSLCKKVNFNLAYISKYSARPRTAATKTLKDNVPHDEKKRRWRILDRMING